MLMFTYFIGITIGFITKQIDITDIAQVFIIFVVTFGIFSILFAFIFNFSKHLNEITKEIKNLEI